MKTILLPASSQSDLDWSEQISDLEGVAAVQFDFGWSQGLLFFNDAALFQTYVLALELFTKEVWPRIKEHFPKLILYRGPLSIISRLVGAEGDLSSIEAATIFGGYLHTLASYLPEEAALYCLFDDLTPYNAGEAAQLLSQDRFFHLELSLTPSDASIGVVLPPDELCSPALLLALTTLLQEEPEVRVIPERRLNELWQGLDELVVFEGAVTPQGRRQLLGFEAAGGRIRSRGI